MYGRGDSLGGNGDLVVMMKDITFVVMPTKYFIDPDYRRSPKTSKYCVNCQRDIKDNGRFIRVCIDWDTLQAWECPEGDHYIGLDCWNKIIKK